MKKKKKKNTKEIENTPTTIIVLYKIFLKDMKKTSFDWQRLHIQDDPWFNKEISYSMLNNINEETVSECYILDDSLINLTPFFSFNNEFIRILIS